MTSLPFATALSSDVNPFVRTLVYNMDNCAGTNKSQYMFGCVALLIMLGHLDAICLQFMLQGHTKFDPDAAAQKTAGAFNSGDTFNHGMLNELFSAHVKVTAYDETILKNYRAVTPLLFEAVNSISSYRQFLFLADDGSLNLGPPLSKALSAAAEFPSKGNVFTDEVLQREVKHIARRSLQNKVLPSVFRGDYCGIGSGTGLVGPVTSSLVPPPVGSSFQVMKVRLFMKMRPSDDVWIEQEGYMKDMDAASIEAALRSVTSVVPEELEGPRKDQVELQMKSYVPVQHVPDEYEVSVVGRSGSVKKSKTQSCLFGESAPAPSSSSKKAASASKAASTTVRWCAKDHGPALISLCLAKHGGFFPTKFDDKNALAKALNVEYDALLRGAKKLTFPGPLAAPGAL